MKLEFEWVGRPKEEIYRYEAKGKQYSEWLTCVARRYDALPVATLDRFLVVGSEKKRNPTKAYRAKW